MAEESDAEKPPAQESFLSQPVCGHSELPYTIPPAKLLQNSDAQGQLTAAVDELLDQLQSKFDNVSKEVFGKRAFQFY
jgi:heat shock factor-binding protein 1